jgi:hypothetical protein
MFLSIVFHAETIGRRNNRAQKQSGAETIGRSKQRPYDLRYE